MEPSWYAIHVRSQFERKVEGRLIDAGIEAFFPYFLETRKWSDRKKQIERPLFPGYILARFDGSSREELAKVLATSGVVRVLGDGSEPSAIPDADVAAIRELLESGKRLTVAPLQQRAYKPGEKVVMMRGSLRGAEVKFLKETKRPGRVVVELPILNRMVATEIDESSIRTAA